MRETWQGYYLSLSTATYQSVVKHKTVDGCISVSSRCSSTVFVIWFLSISAGTCQLDNHHKMTCIYCSDARISRAVAVKMSPVLSLLSSHHRTIDAADACISTLLLQVNVVVSCLSLSADSRLTHHSRTTTIQTNTSTLYQT